jgi:hypothetical protein
VVGAIFGGLPFFASQLKSPIGQICTSVEQRRDLLQVMCDLEWLTHDLNTGQVAMLSKSTRLLAAQRAS